MSLLSHCEDGGDVLDLCVRKNEISKPLLQQQLFKPALGHQDPAIQATLAILHDRIFLPERHPDLHHRQLSPIGYHSPPRYSPYSPPSGHLESDAASNRSLSPLISPGYAPLSAANPTTRGGKPTRPFKAYPKDPLSMVMPTSGDTSLSESNEAYAEFRRRMLAHVQAANGGSVGNKNMKRPVLPVSPTNQQPSSSADAKDTAYWERRRKNNEAAKRSRDARRAKEDEIAIRAAFLEQENMKLKGEVAALRNETNRLRCMLYSN